MAAQLTAPATRTAAVDSIDDVTHALAAAASVLEQVKQHFTSGPDTELLYSLEDREEELSTIIEELDFFAQRNRR